MRTAFIIPAIVVLCSSIAAAADDPCTALSNVVTRPTVTNSVCTVEPDHVLLETGYSNVTAGNGGGATATFPQAQLRIGTDVKHLEVDVQAPSEIRSGGIHGIGDAGGGLKYLFGYSSRMQYGAQLTVSVPTGDSAFSAGAAQTTAALNGSLALSPVFSLTSSQNFARLAAGGVQYDSYMPTLTLSASLPHSLTAFAESAYFTNALGPKTATRNQYIGGLSYDLTPRLQVDLEAITSPTKTTGTYTGIGAGLSYMLH